MATRFRWLLCHKKMTVYPGQGMHVKRRAGLQKFILFLHTTTYVTSFAATRLCLVTRVTKHCLATSLHGRHQDFGCYLGNKLVASHARMRLKQVRVAQEKGQTQYLHCGYCSGKSTDAVAQDRFDGVEGVDAVCGWRTMRKHGVQSDRGARYSGAWTSYCTVAQRQASHRGAFW